MHLETKNNLFLWILLLFTCFIFYQWNSLLVTPVPKDAGYYLSISRDMYFTGKIPCFDIYSSYSPIGYFYYAIPYLFNSTPDIRDFFILNLLLYVVNYFFIFSIIDSRLKNKFLVFTLLVAIIFYTQSLILDIKLENIVFSINTVIVYIINKLALSTNGNERVISGKETFLIGFLAIIGFLTKQYSLLNLLFIPLLLQLVGIKTEFLFLIKFYSIFFLGLFIYLVINSIFGFGLLASLKQIAGQSVLDCKTASYGDYKLSNLLKVTKYFRRDILFDLCLVCGSWTLYKNRNIKDFSVFILIIILSLTPFYIKPFFHYKYFSITYIYFMLIFLIQKLEVFNRKIAVISFSFIITSLVSFHTYNVVMNMSFSKNKKTNQNILFKEINHKISRGFKIFLLDNPRLYFGCNLVTPFPNSLSYDYASNMQELKCVISNNPINEFWIGSCNESLKIQSFENYGIVDSVSVTASKVNFRAFKFVSMNTY